MKNKFTLWLSQHGDKFTSRTLRELREKVGGGRISKMYVDKKGGRTVHVGYVIGSHWLTAYQPIEISS